MNQWKEWSNETNEKLKGTKYKVVKKFWFWIYKIWFWFCFSLATLMIVLVVLALVTGGVK